LGSRFAELPQQRQIDLRLDMEWLLSAHNVAEEEFATVLEVNYLHVNAKLGIENFMAGTNSRERHSFEISSLCPAPC
jgi:hypothetical protein